MKLFEARICAWNFADAEGIPYGLLSVLMAHEQASDNLIVLVTGANR